MAATEVVVPTEPTQAVHQPQHENQATMTIYCWKIHLLPLRVGHIALLLSDGTYISHWPGSHNSIVKKPAAQNTFRQDVTLECGQPDIVISVPAYYVWETQIKRYWTEFGKDPKSKYNLASQNCAHIVSEAIRVGIRYGYHGGNQMRLNNRLFQRPTKTVAEISRLFSAWPVEPSMKFFCSRFIYIFGRKLYASLKDIENYRKEINNIFHSCDRVESGVFDLLIDKIEAFIDTLTKNIENSTEKLSECLAVIYRDPATAPENPMVTVNNVAANLSDEILIKISNAANMYERNYQDAISEIVQIFSDILNLHYTLREYSDAMHDQFESKNYLVELLNLEYEKSNW